MSAKPVRTTILVPVTYWVCNDPDHRHKTEETAAACMEKHSCIPRRLTQKTTKARYIIAAKAWATGASFREAGERADLERTYCRRIINRILKISRLNELGLPPEPDGGIFEGAVGEQYRAHYLARIQAVADFWGVDQTTITVIYGPQGSGKTTFAPDFLRLYQCTRLVDPWSGETLLRPGDLALTNVPPPYDVPKARFVAIDIALAALKSSACPGADKAVYRAIQQTWLERIAASGAPA